jgi:Xaa-Pro aminopeptidase
VKSAWEISQIKKAAEQADIVLREVPELIKPGMSELALTGMVEARLRELGHSGALRIRGGNSVLAMIMAVSGDSALYPTNFDGPGGGEGPSPAGPAGAGWKKIREGETIMLDIVSDHNGYHSDQTRIFYTGSGLPDHLAGAHAFCLSVLDRIERAMQPGRVCADIYNEINAWVQAEHPPEGFMGCGENRVKFFGHGVGLELDEFPIIADRIEVKLAAGMIVAVEPKAFLKGFGAVGVENTYIIEEDGCTAVNQSPVQIQTIG